MPQKAHETVPVAAYMLYNAKIVQDKRNNKKQLADFLFCRAADCLIKEQ